MQKEPVQIVKTRYAAKFEYLKESRGTLRIAFFRPFLLLSPSTTADMKNKERAPNPHLFALLLLGAASFYLTWSLLMFSKDLTQLLQLQKRRSPVVRAIDSYCEIPAHRTRSNAHMSLGSFHWNRSSSKAANRRKTCQDDCSGECPLRCIGSRS